MEPPAAPAVEGPRLERLSEANLQRFTEQHPANARQTVRVHLLDQKSRTYPTRQLENTVTPAPPAPAPAPAPAGAWSPNNTADTALVLMRGVGGGGGVEAGPSGAVPPERGPPADDSRKRERDSSDGPRRKKATLVGAMRPRTSSLPLGSPRAPPAAIESSRPPAGRIDEGAGDSSPLLVARAGEHKDPAQGNEVPAQRNKDKAREKIREHDETHAQPPAKAKAKTKVQAVESDEEAEHAARLEARRQRRLAKALVVKDRTQSAAAAGAAAASKLKASTTRAKKEKHKAKRKRAADATSDESGSDDDERGKKKRRKVSTAETNRLVQNTRKAVNVSGSRLTMKPTVKLGLFHKGAASVRRKIGSKLPDLAFSELSFLNAPRPSPPASEPPPISSSSSSSSGSDPSGAHAKATRNLKRAPAPPAVVITYGKAKWKGKSSKHASKYFDEQDRPPPPPPPRAPSPNKSKRRGTGQAPPPVDAESSKSSSSPPRPLKARSKKIEKQAPRSAPAPPISELASGDRPSDHSAHSLAAWKRALSPSIEREPPEAFIDTSNMWAAPAQQVQARKRSPRASSPPPPRRAASPHETSGSDSHLDRLIKACLEGGLSDSNSRGELSEVPETQGEGSSFRSPAPRYRAPSRPPETRDWAPANQHEHKSVWSQQQPLQDSGADEYNFDDFDAGFRSRDERVAFVNREDVGGSSVDGRVDLENDVDRPFQAPGPTFVGGEQRGMDYDAAGPFAPEDDEASESWRTESLKYGGRLNDYTADQADRWSGPGRVSRFVAGPSRAPYAFEYDPSYTRLHNLDRNTRVTGGGCVAGTDSPDFREAMANHWYRSRP